MTRKQIEYNIWKLKTLSCNLRILTTQKILYVSSIQWFLVKRLNVCVNTKKRIFYEIERIIIRIVQKHIEQFLWMENVATLLRCFWLMADLAVFSLSTKTISIASSILYSLLYSIYGSPATKKQTLFAYGYVQEHFIYFCFQREKRKNHDSKRNKFKWNGLVTGKCFNNNNNKKTCWSIVNKSR